MSRRYNTSPDFLFYSIKDSKYSSEDSRNENVVYAINKDGTLKGRNTKFDLSKIRAHKIQMILFLYLNNFVIFPNRANQVTRPCEKL